MPPITMTPTYEPPQARSADDLVALIEAHRDAVLASALPSDADRELWAAIGLRASPSLRVVDDPATEADRDNFFDSPQDWDSFWE